MQEVVASSASSVHKKVTFRAVAEWGIHELDAPLSIDLHLSGQRVIGVCSKQEVLAPCDRALMVAFVAGIRLRWPMWALLLAALAAIPLLATLPLEYWFRRRGLLSRATVVAATDVGLR